jgi:hypothetical protein
MFLGISLEQKGMLLSNFKYISKILLVISNPNCYKFAQTLQKLCSISYLAYVTYLWTYDAGLKVNHSRIIDCRVR